MPTVMKCLQEGDPEKLAVLNRFTEVRKRALDNLPRLLQALEALSPRP
jgi:hypothetical protein